MTRFARRKTVRLTPTHARRLPIPALRVTPYAWSKLLFLRDAGPTEIGGFGISTSDDLLLVEDVQLVRQHCSLCTVAFDDSAVADFFDEQVDEGRTPEEFGRIWIHTHPGHSPLPSNTDEETFARCFGGTDWSVMLIVACGGDVYARLQLRAGPGVSLLLPLEIDFEAPCPAPDPHSWEVEFAETVIPLPVVEPVQAQRPPSPSAAQRELEQRLELASAREEDSFRDPFADPLRLDPWERFHDFIF